MTGRDAETVILITGRQRLSSLNSVTGHSFRTFRWRTAAWFWLHFPAAGESTSAPPLLVRVRMR